MSPRFRFSLVAAMSVIAAWALPAHAWLRMTYEDAEVIERSELILVGHLEKDSIKYVAHEVAGGGGASWEYHATLVVAEVLKGTLKDKQIPIVINYGLDPLIGGRIIRDNKNIGLGPPDPAIPQDRIDIVDTGNSSHGGPPVLQDAQKDNLWFLRHLGGELGRVPGQGDLGILDPEDAAALKFKDYFKALLSKDVEDQIDHLLIDPDDAIVDRTLRHLSAQHRPQDAPRIAKLLSSLNKKVQALAAGALAEVADLTSVPVFRAALGHANPEVRASACIFLCRFRDTQSIAAIGKVLPGLDALQRTGVIAALPRMESREVVDLLLDQLDEHRDPKAVWPNPYTLSATAAKALRTLTGVEFPLDTAAARLQWDKVKRFPDEVLLRKSMLEDIEALTDKDNYSTRWDAYQGLGRRANQHLGSYDAFHNDNDPGARAASQDFWQSWARDNITRSRVGWVYEGFANSGIVLPRPMDAKGIDTLIAVLGFYGDWGNRNKAESRPNWSTDGGWVKSQFHRGNAIWLLERLTGYKVGLSPYEYDLRVGRQDVSFQRWAAWWKENRDKVKLLPPPEEEPVTADMLAKVPLLRLPGPPLSLTIRPKTDVHIFKGKDPFAVVVEIKNVSAQEVVVEQRPYEVGYTWGKGSGGRGGEEHGGVKQEDYVTLKPGQSITWDQTGAPDVDNYAAPEPVENLRYALTYNFAGSQFGLHAWRGKLYSNVVNCKVDATGAPAGAIGR